MSSKLDFLESYFEPKKKLSHSKNLNITESSLKGDGGHRSYSRIQRGKSRFILMSCGERDPSLKSFVNIQNRLKAHVSSPQLFKVDLKKGFLLMEDLGDESLESFYLQNSEIQSLFFYKQALKQLIKLQNQVPIYKTELLFDKVFFLTEFEQALKDIEKHLNHCSNRADLSFSLKDNSKSFKKLKKECEEIFSDLKETDFVFCHRDYHSRNLMIKNRQTYMIDFQDGAQGPWFYDLASLLYDCYIPLKNRDALYQFYFYHSPLSLKRKIKNPFHIKKKIELQFLQRGLKACGRFCAFKLENNKDTHLKYIPRTLNLIHEIANKYSYKETAQYAKESLNRFQTKVKLK